MLILKSGQYPFVTKLPDYQYINVFASYPEADLTDVKSDFEPVFLTFSEWVSGIDNIYNFPFPKKKRSFDRRYEKPLENEKVKPDSNKKASKTAKELFDELFGESE